jgi:carboxyl-terminal processing protease
MSKRMTKRALFALLALVVGAAIFFGFRYADRPKQKDQVIISLVQDALSNFHFQPKTLNDDLSEDVMNEFLENLDGNRLFLTTNEVSQIEQYKHQLDDQFKSGSSECFDLSYDLLQKGIDRADKIYQDILAEPFNYTKKESTWNNPEKLAYAKNEKELNTYWRKYLKWRVANRIYYKQKNYESDVEKGEEKEPWDFSAAEADAREKEAETVGEWFENLRDIKRIEWLGIYINSLTKVFDPHTDYLPPRQQEDFEVNMTGQFEGIGAQLRQDGDYIVIERIITGSASWRQGELAPGDKILAVGQGDDEPVDVVGWRVTKAVEIIRGKKGTEVRLTVKKKDGTRTVIPIVRDVVELEATFARSAVLGEEKKVGYIRLPKFYVDFYKSSNHNCALDVRSEILRLKEENVEGLIFDLRGNGGGSLEAAIQIVGLFIERGPVVQVKNYSSGTKIKRNKDARVYWDGPLVVMVNDYSASASEIFAAAIQDYGRGIIIGSASTFGKGTVQNMLNLDDAIRNGGMSELAPIGALKITTDKFYRINGGTTQLMGVHADIVLPDAYEFIKVGEKEYDYALPVDDIPAADFDPWKTNQVIFDKAIMASQERINANERMQKNKEYARWLKLQEEDRMIPLNYEAFKEMQDETEETAKQYKNLNRSEDSIAVWSLPHQDELFTTDTVQKVDYQKWFKGLSRDLQLQEAVMVVNDLKE